MGSDNRQRTKLVPGARVNEDELKLSMKARPSATERHALRCCATWRWHRAKSIAWINRRCLNCLKVNAIWAASAVCLKHWRRQTKAPEIRSLMDDLVQTQKALRKKVLAHDLKESPRRDGRSTARD